ncbi:MAG: type III-B CRISPR module RAMP protein Cmr4 [Bacillota bacterium]|nr:type III-B CRISPR module RAMP protein Cmr4 [Bacillota bacterium]
MFEAASILFIYTETPLHVGTGQALGAVDLPIQRERTTGYPIIQASSIKGRLRAEVNPRNNSKSLLEQKEFLAIFGPEGDGASEHAGALSVGDARILLFPVRSLAGVSAWITSVNVLARFLREAAMVCLPVNWNLPPEPNKNEAWVSGNDLVAGDKVVLEEFSFEPKKDHVDNLKAIGSWLTSNALLQTKEYQYWRDILPLKLCILHEEAFRDFVQYSTEVQTHIRLDPEKKTVETGALWTTESLPTDTLLYAPLMATKSRAPGVNLTGDQVLKKLEKMISQKLSRTQLGGDETTGQGIVALQIAGGEKK